MRSPEGNNDNKDQPSSPSEGGNFWTSYSDLLLGLSVIFLVLFFFATIRTGVEQLKGAAEKKQAAEFLRGNVPPQVAEKNRATEEVAKRSMAEIDEKKDLITRSALEVTQLVQNLDQHKTVIDDLLKDQLEKSAALKVASETTVGLEHKVQDLEVLKQQLDQQIHEREDIARRLQGEVTGLQGSKAQLEGDVRNMAEAVRARDQQIAERDAALQGVQRQMASEQQSTQQMATALDQEKSENSKLAYQVNDQVGLLKQRDEQIAQRENALNGMQRDVENEKQSQQQLATAFEAEKSENARMAAGIRDQMGAIKEREGLLAEREAALRKAQQDLGNERQSTQQLMAALEAEKAENVKLAGQARDEGGALRQRDTALAKDEADLRAANEALGRLQQEHVGIQSEYRDCSKTLAALQHNEDVKSRTIASMGGELNKTKAELATLGSQRRSIASDIKSNLNSNGIDAQLNPDSGVLTLTMDEAFQFKNNSYQISDKAKEKLKQIIPIYVDNLLGKRENAGKIASVSITGHASPVYQQEFVDPANPGKHAGQVNQELSEKRARQIADFIFGDDIGYYPYKQLMKAMTSIGGRGLSEPVKAKPDEIPLELCGEIYDCAKSRRVEISFVMKGEESTARAPASTGAASGTTYAPSTYTPSTYTPPTYTPPNYAPSTYTPSTYSAPSYAPQGYVPTGPSPYIGPYRAPANNSNTVAPPQK